MDIMLTAEDRTFKEKCWRFSKEKLISIARKYGETTDIPKEMVSAMAEAGLFEILIPEDLGGQGFKTLRICLAREALAGIYSPADVTLAMQGLGSYPIVLAGNDIQKRKHLKKILRGQLLTTYALTEPKAGSDVNAMTSVAHKTPEGYVLNGKKRFISNGHAADILVVFAKTPSRDNPRAMSAFIVAKDTKGLTVSKRLEALAPHDLVEMEFNHCVIPYENLLGNIGEGYRIAMRTLDVFRMSVGAAAVGIGQAAFEAALAYAKQRVQFGSPIARFQAIQLKLAQMATTLDASRALVYRAALLKDRGIPDVTKPASMAKMYATETAFQVVDQAVQIYGGLGLIKGQIVERLYREIRALRIYEGTSEIQQLIIANSLLKE